MKKNGVTMVLILIFIGSSAYSQSDNIIDKEIKGDIFEQVDIDRYTNGQANSLGVKIINTTLFVADGWDGLRVIDVSNLTEPIEIYQTDLSGYAEGLEISNNLLIVWTTSNVQIFDITDLSNPVKLVQLDTNYTESVYFKDNILFVGRYSQVVYYQFNPDTNVLQHLGNFVVGQIGYDMDIVNDTLFLADYAEGFASYNVSDLNNIYELGRIQLETQVRSFEIKDNIAYISTIYSEGIISVNITDETNLIKIKELANNKIPFMGDIEGDFLYIPEVNYGVTKYNITKPGNHSIVSTNSFGTGGNQIIVNDGVGYNAADIHGIVIFNTTTLQEISRFNSYTDKMDEIYVNEDVVVVNSIYDGIWFYNQTLSGLDTGMLYSKSYFGGSVTGIEDYENYTIITTKNTLHTTIINSSGIFILNSYTNANFDGFTIMNNSIIGSVNSNYVYFTNMSDPLNPTPISSYQLAEFKYYNNIVANEKFIFLSDEYYPMLALNHSNYQNITEIGKLTVSNRVNDMELNGDLLYVADTTSRMLMYNISSMSNSIDEAVPILGTHDYSNVLYQSNEILLNARYEILHVYNMTDDPYLERGCELRMDPGVQDFFLNNNQIGLAMDVFGFGLLTFNSSNTIGSCYSSQNPTSTSTQTTNPTSSQTSTSTTSETSSPTTSETPDSTTSETSTSRTSQPTKPSDTTSDDTSNPNETSEPTEEDDQEQSTPTELDLSVLPFSTAILGITVILLSRKKLLN